ncbi:hypothetical protein GCM10010171_45880 [Actinokineospora fastidiosa]|uniref:Uncharacterized protein n=1 Tax=Actinokineospora fastidiosa TaxID=1816 RepID=A0A918LGG6_9PSEU|nr:hypothetical protein GCM10010171_45880 [Actinokineospora fastidiosa]
MSRAAWADCLTFWPLDSAATAARSAPWRAVLIASSAFTMATWPNTPALFADAPRFSLDAMPLLIWLPRSVIRLPTESTASGSILEPWPDAIPGEPDPDDPPPGEDPPDDDPLWLPLDEPPEEPPCLRDISHDPPARGTEARLTRPGRARPPHRGAVDPRLGRHGPGLPRPLVGRHHVLPLYPSG